MRFRAGCGVAPGWKWLQHERLKGPSESISVESGKKSCQMWRTRPLAPARCQNSKLSAIFTETYTIHIPITAASPAKNPARVSFPKP